MNKKELIDALMEQTGLYKQEAFDIVSMFFDEMANALASGERVELRGLCSFNIREYKSYTGRNPKSGETAKVGSKKLPYFKCGKELRERVDRQEN